MACDIVSGPHYVNQPWLNSNTSFSVNVMRQSESINIGTFPRGEVMRGAVHLSDVLASSSCFTAFE